jgi:hypothetical protein
MTTGEKSSFEQIATQVVELNLRYYRALGSATVDYVRSLFAFVSDRSPAVRNVAARARQAAGNVAASATTPAATATTAQPSSVVVLEAAAGEEAAGGFIVNNHLARRVSAAFRVSPLLGPNGEPFDGSLQMHPEMLTLDPGMQTVVRLSVMIPPAISPGTDYRGTISIPGLADAPIDVIVRRRAVPVAAAQSTRTKTSAAARPRAKTAAKSQRSTPRGRR